jgi:hypothetical protein
MIPPDLPFLDQHERLVIRPPAETFTAMCDVLASSLSGRFARAYGRLVRSAPNPSAFRPGLVTGDELVGFTVEQIAPPQRVVMAGRHRFARYRLEITVTPVTATTSRVAMRTSADFPGRAGSLYRLGIVTSGGHMAVTRMLLRRIADAAIVGAR